MLTANTIVTASECDGPGPYNRVVLLNDQVLPSISEPISASSLETLWGEIEAAGLSERIVKVTIGRGPEGFAVQYLGSKPNRTYQWNRSLEHVASNIFSFPVKPGALLNLATLGTKKLTAEVVRLLATIANPAEIESIEISSTPDGKGAYLLLLAKDKTPLAAAQLNS